MADKVLMSREGRLLRLTLNRPEKRNALDMEMGRKILEALSAADEDGAVGAVLLTGAGPVFCAGMDLEEALNPPRGLLELQQRLFTFHKHLKKPMVAAVQGAALGGGLGLALNAHIVVAAADARLGLTEVRLGIWPFLIFAAVESAAGLRRATWLALTGRVMDGEEAHRIGLVDLVCASGEAESKAAVIAKELSEASASAVSAGLEFVRGPRTEEAAAVFRRRLQASEDFQEGVCAFLERRSPAWPSHRQHSWRNEM